MLYQLCYYLHQYYLLWFVLVCMKKKVHHNLNLSFQSRDYSIHFNRPCFNHSHYHILNYYHQRHYNFKIYHLKSLIHHHHLFQLIPDLYFDDYRLCHILLSYHVNCKLSYQYLLIIKLLTFVILFLIYFIYFQKLLDFICDQIIKMFDSYFICQPFPYYSLNCIEMELFTII